MSAQSSSSSIDFLSPQLVSIVLVEDNSADAELTIRALRRGKINNPIHHLQDGAEALDFLFCEGVYCDRVIDTPPKVILLDLKLPKVSGLEVLRRLKSDPRTQAIPVVVLTSSAQDRDMIDSYELGVNSYIVKPVDFEQFRESVQQIGLYWVLFNQTLES